MSLLRYDSFVQVCLWYLSSSSFDHYYRAMEQTPQTFSETELVPRWVLRHTGAAIRKLFISFLARNVFRQMKTALSHSFIVSFSKQIIKNIKLLLYEEHIIVYSTQKKAYLTKWTTGFVSFCIFDPTSCLPVSVFICFSLPSSLHNPARPNWVTAG